MGRGGAELTSLHKCCQGPVNEGGARPRREKATEISSRGQDKHACVCLLFMSIQ